MNRTHLFALFLILAAAPPSASALQLRWSSGSTQLTLVSATRCTLEVEADPRVGTLPPEWRLVWVAAGPSIQFAARDTGACALDEAQVSRVDQPTTRADSAANLLTAHLCSVNNDAASSALQIVDLPATARGKFKVVALDPADPNSTHVLQSNEVTFNGGLASAYPPTVLHASSDHRTLRLRVTATGADLKSAASFSIAAADSSWELPLGIVSRADSVVVGVASVAALLSACEARVATASGPASIASLPADPTQPLDPQQGGGCSAKYFETLLLSPPSPLGYEVQPKDFSLTPGFVDEATGRYALHLFYIRHNYWYYQPPNNPSQWHPELDEKNLGHAWTSDLLSWHGPAPGDKADTTQIKVRPGKFDAFHVWAPTIIRKSNGDPTYYMFYTGVSHEEVSPGVFRDHQRIGRATSTDLNTWTQSDAVVLSAPQIQWARKNPLKYRGSQQLRDPFVMEYPIGSGNYIMYFVAVDSLANPAALDSTDDMAVGAATSSDLVNWSPMPKPFAGTLRPTFGVHTNIVESPHAFRRNGKWWMPYTVNGDQVFFETSASASPTDTVGANWSAPVWLRGVSQGVPAEMQYWHATEHLGDGSTEWLAAFDDNSISIDISGIFPTDSVGVDSVRLDCPAKPPVAGVGGPPVPNQLRLIVMRPHMGSPDVALRVELPWRTVVRMAVYDLAGRRLANLVNKELPAGATDVTWSGADEGGNRVASGIYFIRLSCEKAAQVSRVVMLR